MCSHAASSDPNPRGEVRGTSVLGHLAAFARSMGVMGGVGMGGGVISDCCQSRPLPFLYAVLHEIKTTSVAGPQCKQANTGPSMCLVPPEVCEKGKCGMAYLIRTSSGADMHMQVHVIKLNRID